MGRGIRRRRGKATIAAMASAIVVGAVQLLGVAAAQEGTPTAQERIVFTIGTTDDIRTLNPFKLLETPEYETAWLLWDVMLRFDQETLGPSEGLATDWEESEDGLTWTFTIRDDATWSDGTPLTAHDIAFTFDYVVSNNIGSSSNYFPFTDGFKAPDDTTLIWKTKKPTSAPLYPTWLYILQEDYWGTMTPKEARQNADVFEYPMSGPFRIVEWEKGQFWRLEANKDYWGGAPAVDEVVFRLFRNSEAMVSALKQGEIDYASYIPPELFNTLKNEPGITTNSGAYTGFWQMSMNQVAPGDQRPYCQDYNLDLDPCESTGHPALLDHDVRLAIAHAIDKETLVEKAAGGYGTPGTTVVPSVFPLHYQPTEDELIEFDLEEANRILDEAGYQDTDGDGIREMPGGGQPLEFDFIANNEEPLLVKATPFITGWLRQLGFKLNVDGVTEDKLVELWLANDFDLYLWGWGPDPDPDFILSTFTTEQCLYWSDTCYSNPDYDELYELQRGQVDPEERQQTIYELQRIVYQDIPEVVLWEDGNLEAIRSDRWSGMVEQPEPGGSWFFSYGPYSYISIRRGQGGGTASEGGIPAWVWIAVLAGIVVVAVAIVLSRRRSDENIA